MKTVLIYAPSTVFGAISAYPLIYKIHQTYQDLKIHLIVDEGLDEYFDFFNFSVSIHVLPKSKKHFFGIHHFCINLHEVFNVDIYFDLQGGFLAGCLGRNFKAFDRIGFLSKRNRFLLNYRVIEKNGALLDAQFLSLLEEFEGDSCSRFSLGQQSIMEDQESNLIPLFKEEEKEQRVLVFIDDLHTSVDAWESFFSTFTNVKFIFWSNNHSESYEPILKSLDKERGLFSYIQGNRINELSKFIDICDAVITNQEWFGNVSSIREKKTFLFVKNLADLRKFRHLIFDGAHIEYTDDSLIKLYGPNNKYIDIRMPSEVSDYFLDYVYPNSSEGVEYE